MAGGNSSRKKAVHPAGAGGGVGAGGGSALLVCSFGGSPAPPLPSWWPGPPIPNVSLWGEGPAGMRRSSHQEWRSWQSQAVPWGGTGCSPEELACGGQRSLVSLGQDRRNISPQGHRLPGVLLRPAWAPRMCWTTPTETAVCTSGAWTLACGGQPGGRMDGKGHGHRRQAVKARPTLSGQGTGWRAGFLGV